MTGSATRSSRRGTSGASGERSTDLRLATLHLRTGMLTLARAELESMAGEGTLDDDALLDLGEVRWRTGDLAGAGDAATAYLDAGRTSTLAFVIAAEAQAALGRPAEARRLANLALDGAAGANGSLDAIFAGMPRATLWPADGDAAARAGEMAEPAAGTEDGPSGAAVPADIAESVSPTSASAAAINAVTHQPVALPDGQTQLEAARAALVAGDVETAAVRLAIVLRVAPVLAPAVLEAAASTPSPLLDLVRGDAFRLLGREIAARRLFHGAIDALDAADGHESPADAAATRTDDLPAPFEPPVDPPADGQVPLPFALPSDGSDPSATTEPEAS